ncbi:MAG: pilus assembly protein TadG-related protein [Candidatus Wallbacteria bacterium]|nr:pilus assembly protein TadG-related protein [Candidatus Wallbacteria bacterium]
MQYNHKIGKKGVSLVLAAISIVVMMGMAALAIDVGNGYMQKSSLDQATQLAALSAAQCMGKGFSADQISSEVRTVLNNNCSASAQISYNVVKGTETCFIDAQLNVPFYFAKVLGFTDVTLNSQALAEVCADGSARLIKENTYDLVPWGIPHGRTTYNSTEQKLYIDGVLADNWTENSSFQFYQGYEYLLKLGLGQPADAIGRKILIPMDSTGDCNPTDANDPICPEVGSHVQADLIKAYGLVYWCLQNNYAVDWLLDYNGGSYLVDYNAAILSATSATSPTVNFSSVSKITLTAAQAATLSNWLAANNSSEGRPYQIVHVTNYPQVAVYTANVYSPGDLMPWGLQDKTGTYPFGYELGIQYTLKYGSGANGTYGAGNYGALTLGGEGASVYNSNIINGASNPNGETYYVGKSIYTKTGNMNGPTCDGLQTRINANKLYVKIPVVSTLDVNGKKSTTIRGFLNFKLNSIDSGNSWVYGTMVDKIPTDQLSYTVNEDSNSEVVAKVLKQAGIPFSWIHDAGVIDGTINNYDWLYTHHEDFQNNQVPAKIAQWVSAGHYYFNMCWATDRFDNALEDYNHDTFGTDTSQYIPRMFFNSYSTKQYSACYRCSSSSGSDCDACRYSGWVWEWVKHTDVNTNNNPTYSLSPRDIMQTQNHVTTISADSGTLGRTNAFKLPSLISTQNIYAKNNSAAGYKYGIYEYFTYSSTNYAKAMIREYKINSTDLGGIVCFMGGHDPSNTPAYRLILNNVMASSIAPAVSKTARTNYGALDLDNADDGLTTDSDEYLTNIEYGNKYFLAPGAIIDTLPYNLPDQTNTGVAFNVGADTSTWNSHATDSQRIVLVPIVSIRKADNSLTCVSPDNTSQAPKSVYGIYQRDKVRMKGIAKFWLLDVTKPGSYESTLGPIENGQVRGIFLGYYISPVDAK